MSDRFDLHGQKVLIIDDTPANIGVLADYLADYGLDVLVAQDGMSGLEKAEGIIPDIILLDVMMPGIDGFETCQLLKANVLTAEIPVIFMTALSEPEHKVKAFAAGAVDYVTKPLHQEEVLARVNAHLQISAQAQLLQAQAEALRALNASKDKFFSIVAHDLKGPFLPLLGNLELMADLAESLQPKDVKEMSASSHRSAKRVFDLLENLLTWARLQMGRMEYEPEVVDLTRLVAKNMELLQANAEAKGITLRSEIEPNVKVYADVNMLNTVVRNLISNALKFTSFGGEVVLAARTLTPALSQQERELTVSIKDNGVGMSAASVANLFKVGHNQSTMGTAKERGTGLGLIMCKEMVELNGGLIWVESEVGQGTTVSFTVRVSER